MYIEPKLTLSFTENSIDFLKIYTFGIKFKKTFKSFLQSVEQNV